MGTVAALRHVAFEDLGLLDPLLRERGHSMQIIDVPIAPPAVADVLSPDLLVVLGGPISVYDMGTYPWLAPEIAAIAERLRAGKPTLGLCLGAQLMAAALGARVYPNGIKELGWGPLTLTDAGSQSPLRHLDGAATHVLHWHGDTFDLPPRATLLASTPACRNQAFSVGNALALQFHPEVIWPAIETWFVGHTLEIATTPGTDVAGLRSASREWTPTIGPLSRRCFAEWLGELGL